MNNEEILHEGINIVVRVGNTVRRAPGKWTASVHALLKHLRSHGFYSAPEPLGFDAKGREILSFMEGEAGLYTLTSAARSNAALVSAAQLLRAYHDAAVDFVFSYQGDWQLANHPPLEVICHGDYAPYNCVYSKDQVIGILDFDMAHPGSRIWDVAYAAYRFVPLSAPDNQDGFGTLGKQAKRLKLFCDAYDLRERENLIPTVLERVYALVDFLYSQAAAGDKIYQKFVAEGYDKVYLNDLNYIKNNQTFFKKSVL